MTGPTHVVCSVATASVIAAGGWHGMDIFGVNVQPVISLIAVPVGALLPDVDIQQSRLGTRFKMLSTHMKHRGITHTMLGPACLLAMLLTIRTTTASVIACLFVGWIIGMMYNKSLIKRKQKLLNRIKDILIKKKGLTTTIVLLVLVYFNADTGASIIFGLLTGWLLHITEDMFNSTGCPICWPVVKGRIKVPFAFIKTRHWTEKLFLVAWTGGFGLWALLILGGQSETVSSIFQTVLNLG